MYIFFIIVIIAFNSIFTIVSVLSSECGKIKSLHPWKPIAPRAIAPKGL